MSRFERILAPTWVSLILAAAGCAPDQGISGPTGVPGGYAPALRGAAIELRVDMTTGSVTVAQPTVASGGGNGGPSFALFGRNEIQATATNVTRSAVGAFTPNRVRVRFDLTLTNRLMNADLLPATFPTPPAAEVVAFAFSTDPAGLFGLKVRASPDWDGGPHNFFNDAVCISITPPGDCFRWEGFGASLAPAASATRAVGFDVDPTVETFTVYVVVAADISERPIPAGKGAIVGVVTSPQLGPLQGIGVSDGATQTRLTDDHGFYVLNDVPPGDYRVEAGVSPGEFPAECLGAPAQLVGVEAGEVEVVSFTVTCPPPVTTGSIAGLVTTTIGNPLANVVIAVAPGGSVVATGADGRYSVGDLATGSYTVSVASVPAGCGNVALSSTVAITPGQTGIADFVVPCVSADPMPGAVIITEFGQNPDIPGDQWVELYNTTSTPIELTGWRMNYAGTSCLIVPAPSGTSTIAAGAVRTAVGTVGMLGYIGLGNNLLCGPSSTGAIFRVDLRAPGGTIVDIVSATAAGFPPTGLGQTFSLDPSAYDAVRNDLGVSWCLSTEPMLGGFGSPGEINPPCPQTIGLIRNASDGTPVDLVGTVTASFNLGSGQFKTYIEDASGGIAIFPTAEQIIGSSVQVTGTRTVFRNEIQVAVTGVTILAFGEPLAPRLIGAAEIQSGSADGELVEVQNVTVFSIETAFGPICHVIFTDLVTTLEIDCTLIAVVPNGTEFLSAKGVLAREEFGVLRLRPRTVADFVY